MSNSGSSYWYSYIQFQFNLSIDEIKNIFFNIFRQMRLESWRVSGDYSFAGVLGYNGNTPLTFDISINKQSTSNGNVADIFVNNVAVPNVPIITDFIDPLYNALLRHSPKGFTHSNPVAIAWTDEQLSKTISKSPNNYDHLGDVNKKGALPKGFESKEEITNENNSYGISTYNGILTEGDLIDNFRRLSWENAEDLVGQLFEKKGYSTTVTQRSGDFGIDVEARTDREYIGIQVKHWNGTVDFDTVAKTLGVQNKYNRVIIVSTKSGFSSHALTWANRDENKYRIELWDTNKFKNELRQFVLRQ